MGLDMYLTGDKYFWTNWEHPEENLKEDGFKLKEKRLELGYWRKHPNLHGYIINEFADGNDNCEDIELSDDDIKQIIKAVTNDNLKKTDGFFFGLSDGSEKEGDLKILNDAFKWMTTEEKGVSRSIVYRASW